MAENASCAVGPSNASDGFAENCSTNYCPANTTLRAFGHTHIIPRQPGVYIGLALSHIFLIAIPAVVFASLTIYLIVKKSLSRHPTSIVFCWTCVMCIIGPVTYGLLMDFSLIFDVPLLGRCERQWEGMILWLCYACVTTAYDFLLAFNAITFYVSLRWNTQRFSMLKINLALAGVVLLSFVVASFWLVIAETQVVQSCRIRGSFCVTTYGGKKEVAITIEAIRVACALLPLNIGVISSLILYCKKVRSSIINFDGAIMASLVHLFVVLALGSSLWNGPTLVMHFGSFDGTQRSFVEMLSTFTLQLNFPLFPLLTLSLHKEVRESVMTVFSMVSCWRQRARAGAGGQTMDLLAVGASAAISQSFDQPEVQPGDTQQTLCTMEILGQSLIPEQEVDTNVHGIDGFFVTGHPLTKAKDRHGSRYIELVDDDAYVDLLVDDDINLPVVGTEGSFVTGDPLIMAGDSRGSRYIELVDDDAYVDLLVDDDVNLPVDGSFATGDSLAMAGDRRGSRFYVELVEDDANWLDEDEQVEDSFVAGDPLTMTEDPPGNQPPITTPGDQSPNSQECLASPTATGSQPHSSPITASGGQSLNPQEHVEGMPDLPVTAPLGGPSLESGEEKQFI